MRAIVVDRWIDPSELTVREAPEPHLTPSGVLIEVRAAGCNFFDTLIVQGKYQVKPKFPFTPGAEIAGVVRAVGEQVSGIRVGDRVLSSGNTGGFAELAAADARDVHVLPDSMSFDEGAALPVIYPTSYAGLVWRGDLREGETLLVHAAAGGVGVAAVQIGRALGEGPERHRGEDPVAGREALDARADGAHHAGQLGARNEGEGRFHLVLPAHHEDVEEVAARRAHVHGERARARLGLRRLADAQVRGLHPLVDDDRTHALLYRRGRGDDATPREGSVQHGRRARQRRHPAPVRERAGQGVGDAPRAR